MKYKIIIVAILILLGNQKTFSKNSSFKGKIIDYETNDALTGVVIVDSNDSQNGILSDRIGNFEMNRITNNLKINFVGYYPIKFFNIPKEDKSIDFGDIKIVANHLEDNTVVGGPPSDLFDFDKQKEQDRKLRKYVLKKYRIKVFGKKVKPYFEGKYIVFDFNKNGKK